MLLDDAIEAILATARSPKERDHRGHGGYRPGTAGLRSAPLVGRDSRLVRHRALGRRQRPSAHRAEPDRSDRRRRGGPHHPPGHGRLGPVHQFYGNASPPVSGMTAKTVKLPGQGGGFSRAILRPLQLSYEDVQLGAGRSTTAACPLRWSFQPLSRVGFSLGTLGSKPSRDCWASIFSRLTEPPWNYMMVRYRLSWTSTTIRISGRSTLLIQG